MPLVTLNSGRTIEVPSERYYFMSDQELHDLMNSNDGEEINNPWYASVLENPEKETLPRVVKELTDMTVMEKLQDLDISLNEE
jgi:hypothetical protein